MSFFCCFCIRFVCVLFCIRLFEGISPLKKIPHFLMVCLDKKQLSSTSSPINCSKMVVIHMKHSHTCLGKTSSFNFYQQTKSMFQPILDLSKCSLNNHKAYKHCWKKKQTSQVGCKHFCLLLIICCDEGVHIFMLV